MVVAFVFCIKVKFKSISYLGAIMTIKELSEKLNISTSTISRVLNDKPGISDKTREMVFTAVKKEGIVSSGKYKNPPQAVPKFIGVIARRRKDERSQVFFKYTLSQFQDIFIDNGFIVVPLYFENNEVDFSKVPISPGDFSGFIIRGQSIPSKSILALKKYSVPFVLLENNLAQTHVDCVICDDGEYEYQLTKRLISKPLSRVIHVTGPEYWYNNQERLRGYKKAMSDSGLETEIYSMEDTTVDFGHEAFNLIKIKRDEKIGITFVNDAMAIGFMHACKNKSYKIPENISITGFDDIPWAILSTPALTTVQIPTSQMGRIAAQRLLDLIKNGGEEEGGPIRMVVTGKIIIRESCT
jgi:LacI family transcriptional regulator